LSCFAQLLSLPFLILIEYIFNKMPLNVVFTKIENNKSFVESHIFDVGKGSIESKTKVNNDIKNELSIQKENNNKQQQNSENIMKIEVNHNEEELIWIKKDLQCELLSEMSENSDEKENIQFAKISPIDHDDDEQQVMTMPVESTTITTNKNETVEQYKKIDIKTSRKFDSIINDQLLSLKETVENYKKTLNASNRDIFKLILLKYFTHKNGYKDASKISLDSHRNALVRDNVQTSSVSPFDNNDFNIEQFRNVFEELSKECKREVKYMNQLNAKNKSQRIIFSFILDLLSRKAASIVATKKDRDHPTPLFFSVFTQRIILFSIFLINCSAFFATVWFILFQNKYFQMLWLQCFIFWLFFESFLVNVFFVLCNHVFLPLMVIHEVDKAKIQLYRIFEKFNNQTDDVENSQIKNSIGKHIQKNGIKFNFAPYFMLSNRISEEFSSLMESKVVLTFSSMDSKAFSDVIPSNNNNDVVVKHNSFFAWKYVLLISSMVSCMFDSYFNFHRTIQDMIVYVFLTFFCGAICIMNIAMFVYHPSMIVLTFFIVFIMVLIPYIYEKYYSKQVDVHRHSFLTLAQKAREEDAILKQNNELLLKQEQQQQQQQVIATQDILIPPIKLKRPLKYYEEYDKDEDFPFEIQIQTAKPAVVNAANVLENETKQQKL